MNERLFRPQFNQMETTEKQALMENLAVRYTMTFLGLQPFDRWGQSCTTGVFEKDGREFVFVPGDTVTLGWDHFAAGPGGDDPGKHGFCSAGIYWPYAGGAKVGGTMLGASQDERSQSDRPPRLAEEVPGVCLERP